MEKLSESELRKRAEEFLNKSSDSIKETSPDDTRNLVEELHVHQMELELQNDELCGIQSLAKNETRYRLLMESMKDAAYICSPGFRIEYMNPAMNDRIGRDATGEICHKAIYGRDEKCPWCVFDQVLQGKHPEYELAVPTENRDYSVSNSPVRNLGGSVSKLTIFRDITENEIILAETKRTSAELVQLIDTANAPIFGIDADGSVTEWNQTAERITGYRKDEVIGKNLVETYITDEYRASVKKVLDEALEGEETANYEFPLYTKSGERVDVLLNSTSRRDAAGQIVGVIGVGQDITSRRKAQQEIVQLNRNLEEKVQQRTMELQATNEELQSTNEELQASRSGFQSVVDKNASGIMVVDEKGIIRLVNPAMQSQFHHYQLSVGNEFALLSDAGGRTEVRITRSVNEIGIAEMDVMDTVWEDKPARLLMLHDITDIKKAQAELEEERASLAERVEERTAELSLANAELARANRLKDEFLANMSHELRTPLTSVLGMSEVLTEQVYGPLNEKQIRSLQSIESSGKHLLSLINDILDLSKISAGKMELQIGRVSVDAVCQSSLKMIRQIAHKKNHKLSLGIDSGLSHIRADMLRVKQMLVNLLMNAVKFTPKRGEISLEVTCVPERDTVEFVVRDTGSGISRENMEKLFKPFVQLDGGLSRKHEGTGLGLVMVSRLAEMHGGSVSVESEEGIYSQFTIMLPWHPGEVVEDPRGFENEEDPRGFENLPGPDGPDRGLTTILMADDNMANIETVADYLKAKSYSVLLAYDGAEAVTLTIEKKPDLILMDIQMPGMDGLEAIKAIRKLEKNEDSGTRGIPIIALTALAMPGDREQCIEAGANGYMSKPVGLKKLAGMIEELLAEG